MKTPEVRAALIGSIMTKVSRRRSAWPWLSAACLWRRRSAQTTAITSANSSMARTMAIGVTKTIHSTIAWVTVICRTTGISGITAIGRLIDIRAMTTVAASTTTIRTMCMRHHLWSMPLSRRQASACSYRFSSDRVRDCTGFCPLGRMATKPGETAVRAVFGFFASRLLCNQPFVMTLLRFNSILIVRPRAEAQHA